ncbi:MAG: ATP-binding protein [Roseobacter sp.]
MNDRTLNFRANTRLKDLIGRGLILNDNVAIIELVKNSNDANSPEVEIVFSQANEASEASELIIQDFGEGMSLSDFETKWLNIAFSGKRDKTNQGRAFAGEKGVGRFSCDRLGRKLRLISKSDGEEAFEAIIHWKDFEVDDIDREISDIPIKVRTISTPEYQEVTGHDKAGTFLEIQDLRTVWDETKLDLLKKELERFIIDPDKKFKVHLKSLDILNGDGDLKFDGNVENRLFEKLDEKTTSVHSWIISGGKKIRTEIRHDGNVLLGFEKANPYPDLADLDLKVQIHYLNPGAKISFKHITGYTSAEYGSIMMFLNGFRVLPYGDPDNDWLALNRRKSQGVRRHLGGREVFGRVEINDDQRKIIPVTSREGVEINDAFRELATYDLDYNDAKRGFIHAAFIALETYVVRGLDWDRVEPKDNQYSYDETLAAMLAAVNQIENRDKLDEIEVDEALIRNLAREKIAAYDRFVANLKDQVADKQVYELAPSEKRSVKKFVDRLDARVQASQATVQEHKQNATVAKQREVTATTERNVAVQQATQEKVEREKVEVRLTAVKHENMFLKLDASKDDDHVKNLHHQTLLYSSTAATDVKNLKNLLLKETKIDLGRALEYIVSIEESIDKISRFADFATGGKYKVALTSVDGNFTRFVSDYLDDLKESPSRPRRMKIINELESAHSYNAKFSPLDIMILVDNFISNSKRHGANKIAFLPPMSENGLFCVTDSGIGLDPSISDTNMIFEKGFTTRIEGSGRGLFHVMTTLQPMKLSISALPEPIKGWTGLAMEIKKNVD